MRLTRNLRTSRKRLSRSLIERNRRFQDDYRRSMNHSSSESHERTTMLIQRTQEITKSYERMFNKAIERDPEIQNLLERNKVSFRC
jgi:hypothetical protein